MNSKRSPYSEMTCGKLPEAIKCVERRKRSSNDIFGSIVNGINLWWGQKYTEGKLRNLGFVIGLRNEEAGIRWRLDYDERKGAHINQETGIGPKRWEKICHQIRFFDTEFHILLAEETEVIRWWRRWTSMNTDKVPEGVLAEMTKHGIKIQNRML
jgi:hypothetical protein